jgi:hypothetical protein
MGVLVEQLAVVLGADQRPLLGGERDDGERTEDGFDGPALEAKFA